jgi:hypothetical protein
MKYIIQIAVVVIVMCGSAYGQVNRDNVTKEVTPYYYEAYNYLISDSLFNAQCMNLDYSDTLKVTVSSSIFSFEPYPFSKEIVEYEFSTCSYAVKEKIGQYIQLKQEIEKLREDSTLNLLGEQSMIWYNVRISFSEIVGNKLIAEVSIYKKSAPNTGLNKVQINYLFYFNPENRKSNKWKIEKVFHRFVN